MHPSDFTRQMRWMRRLGYRGLSMRDVMPYVRGERQGKVFGITFDDGFRNVFENVTPVLSELGFTATSTSSRTSSMAATSGTSTWAFRTRRSCP